MKLNLGCGRNVLPGWINLDGTPGDGIDHIVDLELPHWKLIFERDSVDEFLLSHVLEHVAKPLTLLEAMWHVAKPGALATVRCPYGSSDDADEDPTHVRRLFLGSWGYFGQPHYWRADYGYKGDWLTERVTLFFDPKYEGQPVDVMFRERNVVLEMVAELRAVKPAREPKSELQHTPEIKVEIAR